LDTFTLARDIVDVLEEKKGEDIILMDIRDLTTFADYFVICSADTSTQVRALTSYVKEKIKDLFERLPNGQENDLKNRWNLLDYGDVVVHVLHREERETYAIEKFWNHAFKVPEDKWKKESEEYSEYV